MKRTRWIALGVVAVAALAWGVEAVVNKLTPQAPLAAYLPQGALLTIESPDFAELVHDWSRSPQAAAWMKSDDYAVYSRSRLFGRLTEAEAEFFSTAALPAYVDLLQEVAGKESIFAWYDIGNLEFLYITKLPPGQAEQTHLMQARASFSRRQVGNSVFYVRTQKAGAGPADAGADTGMDSSAGDGGRAIRTVAFATSGDWLLLSTREDLMAGALQLLEKKTQESVATEPWYADAQKLSAHASSPAALHMTLALDRIAKTPQFRTYWIQRNITDLSHYRAAVSDLYRDAKAMREERVLVPKTPLDGSEAAPQLGGLVAMVPAGTGVFRTWSEPTAVQAAGAIEEKLLAKTPTAEPDVRYAPNADLGDQTTGAGTDLEVRIDAAEAPVEAKAKMPDPLEAAITNAHVDGMLTLDSASEPGNGIWVPMHTAVVLHAAQPITAATLKETLTRTLDARLSAGDLGVTWRDMSSGGHTWSVLTGSHTLVLYVAGDTAILTNDAGLLSAMLNAHGDAGDSKNARYIAGFDHASQRVPFARLTKVLDRAGAVNANGPSDPDGVAPAYFSGTMRSLSDAFAAFKSERMVERRDGPNVHQTITWVYEP